MALGMVFAIGLLLFVQFKNVLYNNTTVELLIHSPINPNPWENTNTFHNFKIIMGDSWYKWFIPVFEKNVYNNGYSYCLQGEEEKLQAIAIPKYSQLNESDEAKSQTSSA
jgi:hypothetical protein